MTISLNENLQQQGIQYNLTALDDRRSIKAFNKTRSCCGIRRQAAQSGDRSARFGKKLLLRILDTPLPFTG